jgi:hypothetical protein
VQAPLLASSDPRSRFNPAVTLGPTGVCSRPLTVAYSQGEWRGWGEALGLMEGCVILKQGELEIIVG